MTRLKTQVFIILPVSLQVSSISPHNLTAFIFWDLPKTHIWLIHNSSPVGSCSSPGWDFSIGNISQVCGPLPKMRIPPPAHHHRFRAPDPAPACTPDFTLSLGSVFCSDHFRCALPDTPSPLLAHLLEQCFLPSAAISSHSPLYFSGDSHREQLNNKDKFSVCCTIPWAVCLVQSSRTNSFCCWTFQAHSQRCPVDAICHYPEK